MPTHRVLLLAVAATAAAALGPAASAHAAYVAVERGYFDRQDIDPYDELVVRGTPHERSDLRLTLAADGSALVRDRRSALTPGPGCVARSRTQVACPPVVVRDVTVTLGDGADRLQVDDRRTNGGGVTADGGTGDDVLLGGAGPDTLIGGPGADVLRGGAGDDELDAGERSARRDVVAGGPGRDVVSYASAHDERTSSAQAPAVRVSLAPPARGGARSAPARRRDVLTSIEGAIGTNGADALTGSRGDDLLVGGDGADVVRGGRGDDQVQGTGTVSGGPGDDRVAAGGRIATQVLCGTGRDVVGDVTPTRLVAGQPQELGLPGNYSLTRFRAASADDLVARDCEGLYSDTAQVLVDPRPSRAADGALVLRAACVTDATARQVGPCRYPTGRLGLEVRTPAPGSAWQDRGPFGVPVASGSIGAAGPSTLALTTTPAGASVLARRSRQVVEVRTSFSGFGSFALSGPDWQVALPRP